jgi:hypothetical protein
VVFFVGFVCDKSAVAREKVSLKKKKKKKKKKHKKKKKKKKKGW